MNKAEKDKLKVKCEGIVARGPGGKETSVLIHELASAVLELLEK